MGGCEDQERWTKGEPLDSPTEQGAGDPWRAGEGPGVRTGAELPAATEEGAGGAAGPRAALLPLACPGRIQSHVPQNESPHES